MIPYEWFQFAVLGQVLVWFNLYHRVKLPEWVVEVFYLCGGVAMMWLYASGFKIGYYSNILLIEYVFMTMGAVYVYSQRFTASQALSLGFLTVFINSFYWELPLHVLEWVTVGFQAYMLPQIWRLSPVPFLLRNFRFTRGSLGPLLVGFAVSVAISYLNYLVFRGALIRNSLFLVDRVICLMALVKVILGAKKMKLLDKIQYRLSYTFCYVGKGITLVDNLRLLLSAILICLPLRPFADSPTYHVLMRLLRHVRINQGGYIFEVNDPKDLRMIGPQYEKDSLHWFKTSGDVFVDVGANIGRYTVTMSHSFKKVISFEPVASVYNMLERNILLNDLRNVEPLQLALLDKDCFKNIWTNQDYHTISSLYKREMLDKAEKIHCVSFDEIYDDSCGQVDLIKIDVEGSEYAALKGMSGTIKKYKPKLIVEIWPQMFEKVNDYLNSLGYTHVERHRARYLYIPKTY